MAKCEECGAVVPNEDAWRVGKNYRKIVCTPCLLRLNPDMAKTYYYDSPYCPNCGTKARGWRVCPVCKTELKG
jgi:ribosomal protein S26